MKPSHKPQWFLLLLLVALVPGCANNAKLLSKVPDCTSSLEGYLHSSPVWAGNPSVLIIRRMRDPEVLDGVIMEKREDGILFDQDRISRFVDPEPKLYPYKNIIAAVDEKLRVIHGDLPKDYTRTWGMDLELEDGASKPLHIKLKPNEYFGYCVPPGLYYVGSVRFSTSDGDRDRSVGPPRLKIRIQENRSNYIGDVYLHGDLPDSSRLIAIPYRAESRAGLASMGLVGAVMTILQPGGYHYIDVVDKSPFLHNGKREGVVSLLQRADEFREQKPDRLDR